MLHDMVFATYKGGYRIEITFENGEHGVVNFSPYLQRGGVFAKFRDLGFFREFRVNAELGTLTWADEIEVAPETLYAQATGAPLPDWMMP